MADIITPILNIVSVLCSCSANNRCCYLLDLQENKDALHTAMEELKATRADVKRRVDEAENNPNELMKRTHEVDSWLQHVLTIEGEVSDILEKADEEIQGRCFGGYSPKNCWAARKIGKLVIRKLPTVNDLRSKGSFGDVAYKLPPPLVQKEPVGLTFGMESTFDKALKSLAKDEVRIMGLYGQGGVGKTTLLRQINNEFLKNATTTTTHGFDVVIFVVVSKTLEIKAIQKMIGKRLELSSSDRISIFNALSKKNFLLLLDDIWERIDLQSIGIPPLENNKSKVVFTTRSETVCGLMEADEMLKVECLPWNEAWSLFQEKVGERALNSFPRARELAKAVARECGGLPLALITTGRAMSAKKTLQEWNHAITTLRKSASDFPGMSDEVLPLLKLSYDNLRNDTIKSCFIHCGFIFRALLVLDKVELIDYWLGEGLILLNESSHIDEARNHGHDIIGILKGACLLESGWNKKTEVMMHDTIQDLALWIAHECGGIKRDKMLINEVSGERWSNEGRIDLLSTEIDLAPPKFPHVLTLRFLYKPSGSSGLFSSLPNTFFQFIPLLRVLDLSGSRMKTLPASITELLELQYLRLSFTTILELPKELRKLVKLKYLYLSYMMCLKEISSGVIGSLLELRVLDLTYCSGADDWDLEELYKLKHLNDLSITIRTEDNLRKLLINQNLRICTRSLVLFSSPLFSSPSSNYQIKVQVYKTQRYTTHPLTLPTIWPTTVNFTLGKLKLLSNLESLILHSHQHSMAHYYCMAHHLHSCFQNLSYIEISNCNAMKDITWVIYVGNLNSLHVYGCKEMEEIIIVFDDFGGRRGDEISTMTYNVDEVFKRLETLSMWCLPKLKSICRNALAFPCLETLKVSECPQLKKLPFDSGSNINNTLQEIKGNGEWWNELQWEEEDQHNKNELLKSKFLPYFIEEDV